MKSYMPVTYPLCLTVLNQAYLPLLHLHKKTFRAHSEIRNIILDELTLFEVKDEIKACVLYFLTNLFFFHQMVELQKL